MPPKAKGECQTKFLWIFVNFLRLCDYDLTAAKKKNGYQMPEEFKAGFVLKDVYKKPWCLGKPIGQGGFGLIYIGKNLNTNASTKYIYFQTCSTTLANKGESQQKQPENGDYVVKIEPKENGPLFCETHFYNNCAKEDDSMFCLSMKRKTSQLILSLKSKILCGLKVWSIWPCPNTFHQAHATTTTKNTDFL